MISQCYQKFFTYFYKKDKKIPKPLTGFGIGWSGVKVNNSSNNDVFLPNMQT